MSNHRDDGRAPPRPPAPPPRTPVPPPLPAAPSPPAREVPPGLFDPTRFREEGEIARGGMGSIRSVIDLRLARREAMKVLDPAIEKSSRVAERFLEEARITGSLDHPNIVPIYDLGLTADGRPAFITMKLVEGRSLAEHIDRLEDARLESEAIERSIQILIKVCDAVSFAHDHGIIHCDLKPGNIMVGSHGQVYVMDWGLSMATAAHTAGSVTGWTPRPLKQGTVTGTPAYMAPEQALGMVSEIDARTDVFCLGGTLYRLLSGRPPYSEPTVQQTVQRARSGNPRRLDQVVRDDRLPPELCRITMKALATDKAARYQTVEEMKADLEKFLRGGGWLPTQTFAEGEVIVQEGETALTAYILVEGLVEAYKTIDGRHVPLRLMGPGEVFGEAAVFTAQPRTASIVAKSAVTVKVVTAESLERELSRNTWLTALVRALAERFRDIDTQLARYKLADGPRSSD